MYDGLALLSFYRFTQCTKLPRALLLMFLHGAVEELSPFSTILGPIVCSFQIGTQRSQFYICVKRNGALLGVQYFFRVETCRCGTEISIAFLRYTWRWRKGGRHPPLACMHFFIRQCRSPTAVCGRRQHAPERRHPGA